MKILLLYNVYSDELGSSRPPLGTGYLAQALEDAGVAYDVLDMKLGYSEDDVLGRISGNNYDLVGITVYTVGHKYFFRLAKKIKDRFPKIKIVVGGPHITLLCEQVMRENPHIDFAVTGEAETALVKLCKSDVPSSITGLSYREGDGLKGDFLSTHF